MREKSYSIEHKDKKITALVIGLDDGYFVLVTGGSRTHIGAVSSAGYDENIEYQFPGHRDVVVSRKWADTLHGIFKEPIVAACGIHYDGVDKEQINAILAATDELLEDVVKDLREQDRQKNY